MVGSATWWHLLGQFGTLLNANTAPYTFPALSQLIILVQNSEKVRARSPNPLPVLQPSSALGSRKCLALLPAGTFKLKCSKLQWLRIISKWPEDSAKPVQVHRHRFSSDPKPEMQRGVRGCTPRACCGLAEEQQVVKLQ